MVVLTEMASVFWGVILEGGKKKYTQTTEKPVHISMAALDPTKPCGDGPVSVMIEHNTGSYVLCSLLKDKLYQQPLNLEFAAGEEISFIVHGTGSVHLSGFVMPEDDFNQYGDMSGDEDLSEGDLESEDEEDDSDEDEAVVRPGKKRQLVDAKRASKKAKITLADMEDDDDEDDSDDDDFIIDEAEEASDDDEDDDLEEEDESDVEESPKPVGNKNGKAAVVDAKTKSATPTAKDKAQNASAGKAKTTTTPNAKGTDKAHNTPKQQAPSVAAAAQPKEDGDSQGKKKKKKNKKKNKNKAENQQQTQESPAPGTSAAPAPASKVPAKRVAEGGVVIEDVKQGHGPEAQLGKKVAVYYTGRLMNGKVFDCCTSGNGFKFKLGKKEVISGWDVGVKGMKVGGKRKLVIPPKMGYGSSAAGPIPANSTLVFDVELKSVN